MRIPANKIVLTDAQIEYIRENYATVPVGKIAEALGLKTTYVRHYAYSLGIKKMEMEYWTDEMADFLCFVYRFIGDHEISDYMQRHYPKKKPWTHKHIEKKRRYLNLKRTTEEKRAINRRNVLLGCYAQGNVKMWRVRGVSPIGTVKLWKQSGRIRPAIKTESGYVERNRWLWEQKYGPVPEEFVVAVKNGAPLLCEIDDLELVTKAEIMKRTAQSDETIVKRYLKIKDPDEVKKIVQHHPEIIELKRNSLILNGAIRKITAGPAKP